MGPNTRSVESSVVGPLDPRGLGANWRKRAIQKRQLPRREPWELQERRAVGTAFPIVTDRISTEVDERTLTILGVDCSTRFEGSETRRSSDPEFLRIRPSLRKSLRKEVIQPQVLLRLPCYDFVPVTDFAVDTTEIWRLRALPAPMT